MVKINAMQKSFLLLLCFLAMPIWAQNSQVTLKSAKTTCIKLLYGREKDVAAAKSELTKWGHFKVTDDCSKSDLNLWIAAGSPAKEGACHVTVQAINQNQQVLWSDTRDCKGATPPVVAQLVRKLRSDMARRSTAKK